MGNNNQYCEHLLGDVDKELDETVSLALPLAQISMLGFGGMCVSNA